MVFFVYNYALSSKLDDVEDSDLKMEMIENDFDGFCKDVNLNFDDREKIKNKVKDMLFDELVNRDHCDISTVNTIKEELFYKLCNQKLVELNDIFYNKIKEFVSKSISEPSDPNSTDFINKRTIFKNFNDVSFRGTTRKKPVELIWYMPKNDDEIRKAIEIEFHFKCIITNDEKNFDNYIFAFEYFEHNNDYVLAINDVKRNFNREVFKSNHLLGSKNYIEDENTYRQNNVLIKNK